MKLTVVGCGDAFGSGGRVHTGFHLASQGGLIFIDCAATALTGFRKFGPDPDAIGTVCAPKTR